MFNLGGFFGGIGRILPGYTEGYRNAISDNWNDLNQYNKVQAGQIQNAFDEAMFNPRLSMGWDAAANTRMGVNQNAMRLAQQRQVHPGMMQALQIQSEFMPAMAWANNWGLLSQAMGLGLGGQGFQWNGAQSSPVQQNRGGGLPSIAQWR